MANRAWMNFGHMYANATLPAMVSFNFIVDSTNGNGLGIRSLKSNGYVRNVFMHTSATPGTNNGVTNPNPAAGYIYVQLADNYARALGSSFSCIAPIGSSQAITSGLTVGQAYIITSIGTSTAADFAAIGLQPGLTPTVGQAFTATSTGAGSGSGAVAPPSNTGIDHVEGVGDPNQSIGPQGTPNQGAYSILQCMLNTTVTAPNNNSVLSFTFLLDNSSVNVDGL
jgi:hypothetical protein